MRKHIPLLKLPSGTRINTSNGVTVYETRQFLSDVECDAMVELAKSGLARSKVYATDGSQSSILKDERTSESCFFRTPELRDHSVVRRVRQRLIALAPIDLHRTTIQVTRYLPTQRFDWHHDAHDEATMQDTILRRGQGHWTCMIYLGDDCTGGETQFQDCDLSFEPEKGTLLTWNNLLPDGTRNMRMIHRGAEVLTGEKWILNQWLCDLPWCEVLPVS